MKTFLSKLLILLFLASCAEREETDSLPPPLFPQPKTIKVNLEDGYMINQVSGDSIEPILTKNGDTLVTGKPIPVIAKVINLDSVKIPRTFKTLPTSTSTAFSAYPNVYKIPKDLPTIPINQDSVPVIYLKDLAKNNSSNYVINSLGKKIKTGVVIPAQSKKVEAKQPKSSKALSPRLMDGTIGTYKEIDIEQGMASSFIYSILEDKNGNIWIGTSDGVSKYDGVSFEHYTTIEGLSGNGVFSMLEDKIGNIWFGTNVGVCMYDGESFNHFTEAESMTSNRVHSIYQDKSGNLWFGTGEGLTKYDGKSFLHLNINEGPDNNVVQSICEDKDGNIWFGIWRNGLYMFNGESFRHYSIKDGLNDNTVRSILEDTKGNLWFGSDGGLNMFNGESISSFEENIGVRTLFEDTEGNLWFGSNDGVRMYNGETGIHITEKEGLSNNDIYDIKQDESGKLWFGTWGGGLSIFELGELQKFAKNETLFNNTIYSIFKDKKGNVWISTVEGLVKYDGNSFTLLTKKEGLMQNSVYQIFEDKNENLWIGSRSGLCKYDGRSFEYFTTDEGLISNNITAIYEDKIGNLWIGTFEGFCMYNGKYFTHFSTNEDLMRNTIWSITEDSIGKIWFGTWTNGAIAFDGKTFTRFTEKQGLSSDCVYKIFVDRTGNIWFGTADGLSMLKGETFTYFTDKQGLVDNSVHSIIQDHYGNLWLGTRGGLSNYNGKSFKTIQKQDGLKSSWVHAICEDNNGNIWFGTWGGLSMSSANAITQFTENNRLPKVTLRQLTINENLIDYRCKNDSLANAYEYTGVQPFENFPLELELQYNQNNLTFHYSAIDWTAPDKIEYSFRLNGLNDKWSQPSIETKADFRQITSGIYTFEVRAIGESGIWSEPFEYEFTIHPPWWHTWWARTGYGLAAILLIWGYVRWRTAKLKQRQKELEKEVDIATKEIRKQKTEVEQQKDEIEKEKNKSEELLLNILPHEVAEELKESGVTTAKHFNEVTVLFTDFVGFTSISSKLSPTELVAEIHKNFSSFDNIIVKHGLEKIKTIGDAYMAVCGLPEEKSDHAKRVINAALDIRDYITTSGGKFQIRIGVNTGAVVAGIVGIKKYAYDIWGDAVNIASRMESNSEAGRINISETTYKLLKDDADFTFVSRGKIDAKGKGEIRMFFVDRSS